jgi:hypothetical protein
MKQHTKNQERSRKYGGSSSFMDSGEPSKAPRQDEESQGLTGEIQVNRHPVDANSDAQGISNRPVKEEHAFPDSDQREESPLGTDSVDTPSKQQGGSRGRV